MLVGGHDDKVEQVTLQAVDGIGGRKVFLVTAQELERALVLDDAAQCSRMVVGPAGEQVLNIVGACLVVGGDLPATTPAPATPAEVRWATLRPAKRSRPAARI